MLKTLLKVLCEGALWWPSTPLHGFPLPGGGEGALLLSLCES